MYICTTQLNRESRSIQVAWCMSVVNTPVLFAANYATYK